MRAFFLLTVLFAFLAPPIAAQETAKDTNQEQAVVSIVEAEQTVSDEQIKNRLSRILQVAEAFPSVDIRVQEGVVKLNGTVRRDEDRRWVDRIARRIEGVVAVLNRVEVRDPAWWEGSRAADEVELVGRAILNRLPLIVVVGVVLLITGLLSILAKNSSLKLFDRVLSSSLLARVAARVIGVMTIVVGLYLVLRIAGLTQLAATVVGGTGLLGLILGFAFRDIAENFLASVLLSLERPFRIGDLIEVEGRIGMVERMTTRCTVLVSLTGDHVQVPNATIYKSSIRNVSLNPKHRLDFTVGIGYEDSIAHAQAVVQNVLAEHQAVLADPEPWVLVEQLASSTVVLRVYFWIDVQASNPFKVTSSVIRQVKAAFQQAGISMPDDAREIIFPQGVPVSMLAQPADCPQSTASPADEGALLTVGERDFNAPQRELAKQIAEAPPATKGGNLL
ncbi:MAG: mechanosensitive ion channel [Bdellovibrionales bacterium]|nr:mechanosensitive ion channel [Bdellovibrionales bacterium]